MCLGSWVNIEPSSQTLAFGPPLSTDYSVRVIVLSSSWHSFGGETGSSNLSTDGETPVSTTSLRLVGSLVEPATIRLASCSFGLNDGFRCITRVIFYFIFISFLPCVPRCLHAQPQQPSSCGCSSSTCWPCVRDLLFARCGDGECLSCERSPLSPSECCSCWLLMNSSIKFEFSNGYRWPCRLLMMVEALLEESKACVTLEIGITMALFRKEFTVSLSVTPLLWEGGEQEPCSFMSARSS